MTNAEQTLVVIRDQSDCLEHDFLMDHYKEKKSSDKTMFRCDYRRLKCVGFLEALLIMTYKAVSEANFVR